MADQNPKQIFANRISNVGRGKRSAFYRHAVGLGYAGDLKWPSGSSQQWLDMGLPSSNRSW